MALNKRLIPRASSGIVTSEHFDIVTYTGNGSTKTISGLSFAPDLFVIKKTDTSGTGRHWFMACTNNNNTRILWSPSDNSSHVAAVSNNYLVSWNSDGITIGSSDKINESTYNFTAYFWKVNGATSNPDVNLTAGISTTGFQGTSQNRSFDHGLGTTPVGIEIYQASVGNTTLPVFSKLIGISATDYTRRWETADGVDHSSAWRDYEPTATLLKVGTWDNINDNLKHYTMWNWTPIEGFSAMDDYTGNGTTTTINCGFKPGLVIIKIASVGADSGSGIWADNKSVAQSDSNVYCGTMANDSGFYNGNTNNFTINFTSTGFEVVGSNTSVNASARLYSYTAYADPDV